MKAKKLSTLPDRKKLKISQKKTAVWWKLQTKQGGLAVITAVCSGITKKIPASKTVFVKD